MKKALAAFAALLVYLVPGIAPALDQYPGDTAIYGVSTATIEPNVLIVLDNSGSMSGEVVTAAPYDSGTTYTATRNCGGSPCEATRVYRWRAREGRWVTYIADAGSISCTTARQALTTAGTFNGRLRSDGSCRRRRAARFAIGNYINWQNQAGGTTRRKIDIAKEVLSDLINTTTGVRFGLMIFNTSNGGHVAGVGDRYGWSGYDAYVKDMDAVFTGTTTNRTALVNTINNISPFTWTPLAETMYEALQYFEGDSTAFNGSYTYTSPIQYSCQQNYVIIITDGMSTMDRSPYLRTICNSGDCDGDGFEPAGDPTKVYNYGGSDYLDDVADYMYDNDLLADSGSDSRTTGRQNVTTYTIGFGLAGVDYAERLLQETAFSGGGQYYSAASTTGLSASLGEIIATIIEDDTSFVAPVVPISPENRSYSGGRVYMGFFKPATQAFWSGNLKKYAIDSSGAVVDSLGNPATNSDGSFKDNAVSYWNTTADGGDVENGGTGALLAARVSARNIYTYTGTSPALTDTTNAFTTSNPAVTTAMLGVTTSSEKDRLIDYVHGLDSYDENTNGNTTERRDWILGDILHSSPALVRYSAYAISDESSCSLNRSLIFVGANDGMLHAFRDCDGSEAWAFIPQDLLPDLRRLAGATHTYFVDSSPALYTFDSDGDGVVETGDGDRVIIIFGERRGGQYYYALDVSSPDSPGYMWRLGSSESPSGVNTDYSELAETWSVPEIAYLKVTEGTSIVTKVAAFIGAGYDNAAEDVEPPIASTRGRGVYAVEVATLESSTLSFAKSGYKIWGYTNAMTRSVPSRLSVVDIGSSGYADRIYAGDMGGNVWRFDINDTDTSNWTGRVVFTSGGGRKIFERPAVTLEFGYELLFFSTGDRAHPTETGTVDRLYAVKDAGQSTLRTEAGLSNATASQTVNIASTYGWYIALSGNAGEKSLSPAAVINKVAYYTTYTPPVGATATACSADNRGTARFYALGYLTAGPAYNLNTLNDTLGTGGERTEVRDTSDRSTIIGGGIPSGMVTVINSSGVSAVIGTGGALVTPQVSDVGANIPLYWRQR